MILLLSLAGLLVAGAAWHRFSLARERSRPLPSGRMVDAGGLRLRLITEGESQPGPTVVLECGIAGPTSASWAWVRRAVQGFAPVVAYDRAGLGGSDPGPLPRDGRTIARELRAALANAGIAPPYVFVGHSFGGLIARIFTAEFPDDVVGVVLVDSTHPHQLRRAGISHWYDGVNALLGLAPIASELGLVRAIVRLTHIPPKHLPDPERTEHFGYLSGARHWRGVAREFGSWKTLTAAQAAACESLGSRPLVVLTAGMSLKQWPGWPGFQAEIARLSSDAEQRVFPDADHALLVVDETQSRVVVQAVRDVVTAVRERRPLTAR